ncbi:DUF1702 family protein [Micromonospora sediminicola]|uniref:DUF1702 family protein n=1 Tax=Micromonospora sediminicola TaxID=946078 RepID=UPI0033E55741
MPTAIGSFRRLVMTPSLISTTFSARGFPAASSDQCLRLEAIPQAVVTGFEWGIDSRDLWELERRLELVEAEMRGFAYEGATMALTIVDAITPGARRRAEQLLAGPAVPHTFLTYIGIGFAMSHLPRPLWKGVLPDLTGTPYYPTMSWLAVDGYGFDLAYFHTDRYVHQQRRPRPYPWHDHADYFLRAVDQGIGRALWFIHGAQPAQVAQAVNRFQPPRRADLWSGIGLAAAFAGGCDPGRLAALVRKAESYHPHLAQGAVFAARARTFSGCVPEHTEPAVLAMAGLTVSAATSLADASTPRGTRFEEPAYETWRTNVRNGLSISGNGNQE